MRTARFSVGGFLVLVGALLAAGGAWLVRLGGSAYYLVAGLCCLVAASRIIRGRVSGVLAYAAMLLGTLTWAIWEVGLHFWLLEPRVPGPTLVGLVVAPPGLCRSDFARARGATA